MKKILISTILILGLATFPIYAQDIETATVDEDTVTTENTEDTTITDEEMEKELQKQNEEGTLSEQLEVTQTPTFGFLSILLAVMAPTLLIVLAYLIIKMSKK
jgi:hypothetical protein